MRVGKLKEPDRVESVGFNLSVFIASSALAYTSGGYCPSVLPLDGSQLVSIFILLMKNLFSLLKSRFLEQYLYLRLYHK